MYSWVNYNKVLGFVCVFLLVQSSFLTFLSDGYSPGIVSAKNSNTMLFVGGIGAGNYSSIQDAIDNASNEDVIYVYSNTYNETITIDKKIMLLGENINQTIIDGKKSDNVVFISADGVHISNFTLCNSKDNSGSMYYAGIKIISDNVVISSNILKNNNCGILLATSENTLIKNNMIFENYRGIRFEGSKKNIVIINKVFDNIIGLYLVGKSSENEISDNNISKNIDVGIKISDISDDNTMYHNFFDNENNAFDAGSNIWDNDYPSGGNYWSDYRGIDIDNNYDDVDGPDGIGDTPYNISGGTNQDRYPLMSNLSQGAFYVDDDYTKNNTGPLWNSIYFNSIQKAINTSINGTVIYVLKGDYHENIIINKSIKLVNKECKADTVKILGNKKGTVMNIIADNVEISYFTIAESGKSYNDAGIKIWSKNNRIHHNIIEKYILGIYCDHAQHNLIFNNTIHDSYEENGVGIKLDHASDIVIHNNTISLNKNDGIILENSLVNNRIFDNIISENTYYGIWVSKDSSLNKIYHNSIQDNLDNAFDEGLNFWDNGYPSGGNKWGDYDGEDIFHGKYQDLDGSDGFGDVPYNISGGNNKDRYPIITYCTQTQIMVDDNYTKDMPCWNITRFNSIQKAIDAADTGSTITVLEGTYYENIYIDISINISGISNEMVRVVGDGHTPVFTINASDVFISGLSITQGGIKQYESGVLLLADETTISNNVIENNKNGITIESSNNQIINNKIMSNRQDGIFVNKGKLNTIHNNFIVGNIENGIYLYHSSAPIQPNQNNNIIIDNNIIESKNNGIMITRSYNNIVQNNSIEDNSNNGIYILKESNNNMISDNEIQYNFNHGIFIDGIKHTSLHINTISNNVINSNIKNGIQLIETMNTCIKNNTITENNIGLYFQESDENEVFFNIVSSNKNYGFYITLSKSNIIYNNKITNEQSSKSNANNAYDDGTNIWNGSYMLGGNYWDDIVQKTDTKHGPKQNLEGKDGICDSEYFVSHKNYDHYPFSDENGWEYRLIISSIESGIIGNIRSHTLNLGIRITVKNYGQKDTLASLSIKVKGCVIDRLDETLEKEEFMVPSNQESSTIILKDGEIWNDELICICAVRVTIEMDYITWTGCFLAVGPFFFQVNGTYE